MSGSPRLSIQEPASPSFLSTSSKRWMHDTESARLREKEEFAERVNNAFNQIRDLNDKDQVILAIKLLDNKQERCKLIDKILQRKRERMNADEIVKLSKVQPLLSRFLRKLKKKDTGTFTNVAEDRTTRNDEKEKLKIGSITLLASNTSIPEPAGQTTKGGASTPGDHKPNNGNFDLRARVLQLFSNMQSSPQQPNTPSHSNSNIKGSGIVNKSVFRSKLINYKKVSENSIELIQQGREKQRNHATSLLKEVQRQSLASHFNSYSLHNNKQVHNHQRNELDTSQLNTFQLDTPEDIEYLKKQKEHINSYANYQNSIAASKVVQSEILNYVERFSKQHQQQNQQPARFLVTPSILKSPKARSIETNILFALEKNPQIGSQPQHQQNLNIHHQQLQQPQVYFKSSSQTYRKQQHYPAFNSSSQTPRSMTTRGVTPKQISFFSSNPNSPRAGASVERTLSDGNNKQHHIQQSYQKGASSQFVKSKNDWHPGILVNSSHATTTGQNKNTSHNKNTLMLQSQQQNNLPGTSRTYISSAGCTPRSNKQRAPSMISVGSYSQQQFEVDCLKQRDKTGFTKKQYFNYSNQRLLSPNEHNGLMENDPKEIAISNWYSNSSNREIELENEEEQQREDNFMRTFETNSQIKHRVKNIITVDKWNLEGQIHHTGNANSELINENKNDESLVSFTEIKLDKLYKETRNIQNQQRILERAQTTQGFPGKRQKSEDFYKKESEKQKINLNLVKNEILHTTQAKLRQKRKQSTPNL